MNLSDFDQSLENLVEIDGKYDIDDNLDNSCLDFQPNSFQYDSQNFNLKQNLQTGEHLDCSKLPAEYKQTQECQQQKTLKLQVRAIRKIQVNDRKLQQIDKVKRGQQDQTNCLNKNLHTETKNFLKKLIKLRCIDSSEVETIKQYIQTGPSFKSTYILYKNPTLRKKCLNYYIQANFVKNILASQHMGFKNKTMMLKYLGRIHQNAGSQKMRWKDNFGSY